jgi:hypothetical protein
VELMSDTFLLSISKINLHYFAGYERTYRPLLHQSVGTTQWYPDRV